jgi:hypothetical protein
MDYASTLQADSKLIFPRITEGPEQFSKIHNRHKYYSTDACNKGLGALKLFLLRTDIRSVILGSINNNTLRHGNWFFMTPSIATKFQYINSL